MARRRRGPPWAAILGVFGVVGVVGVSSAFWAGAGRDAPSNEGVCWRMTDQAGKPHFAPLASNILNLESCAAYLERIHLTKGGEVQGAFQGRFIFIDDLAIRSATRLDGSRWRVFFDPQRTALDARLRLGGKTPSIALMPSRG